MQINGLIWFCSVLLCLQSLHIGLQARVSTLPPDDTVKARARVCRPFTQHIPAHACMTMSKMHTAVATAIDAGPV